MTDKEYSHSVASNAFTFSDEQLLSICEISETLVCNCPARLVRLLWEARTFYHYTTGCIDRLPEEAENHRLLGKKIVQVDALLSQMLVELLQEKELLDDQQQIDLKLLRDHQIQAILAQQQQ